MPKDRPDQSRNADFPQEDVTVLGDAAVLRRHLAGDRTAFAEIVRRHGRYMFAVASRLVDRAEAEDIVQVAFLNAVSAAAGFEGRASVRTWLHQITVNAALNHLRRRSVRISADLLDQDHEPPPTASEVDDHVVGEAVVAEILDGLPTSTRQLVVLVDLLGYSIADAARMLGMSEGTVKSRRARAFARIARRMQR